VFEKADRSRDKWFTVLSRDNGGHEARLGLAISKKHCRKSTSRNTIKRIVRESFRQHQQQLFDSLAGHWRRCSRGAGIEGGQE
jgi:ribonuclease P protein component